MKALIYGILLVLSQKLAHAENRPLSPPELISLSEGSESERLSSLDQATFDVLQLSVAGTGSSASSSVNIDYEESELGDFPRLSKTTAKIGLELALTKATDENDIWLLKSTLRALENAQIRIEGWGEERDLSCGKDENGFVEFGYPHEIFVCNRFINFFPDGNERTVAMAQLLTHEATHLAEMDDGTRLRGAPEGCRATYVEVLVAKLSSGNHKLVYRTYDMERCEENTTHPF
jgi:hypothetical protein